MVERSVGTQMADEGSTPSGSLLIELRFLMNRLRILVDMDSTINYFIPHFISAVKAAGYDFDTTGYNNYGTWDIENFIMGTDDPKTVMSMIMSEIELWETIPPMPGASTILREMSRFHDIVIATTPWGTSQEMKQVKIDWLARYFPFIKPTQINFTAEKWTIEGDVIFDDKPDTIKKCGSSMITVVPDQIYNRDIPCDFRYKTWAQVPKIMNTIERYPNRLR